jgi:8-oxo-dGTP pyrophosphatase MutT (NUDIX family)
MYQLQSCPAKAGHETCGVAPTVVMSSNPPNLELIALDRTEIAVEPWSWRFTVDRRDEIDRHFAQLQRERSAVWNGRVLLMNRYAVRDRVLHGACFETNYASFSAWKAWDFPDPDVYNVFAAAALQGADGAYLVGEMAPGTAAAGLFYFPCGTPEPDDIDDGGALDLADNLPREFKEETGLDIGDLRVEPAWSAIFDRCYIALLKRVVSREPADALRSRIMRYLESETQPEFVDIRVLRGPDDLPPRMPKFAVAYLQAVWRQ